jgi:hypothetical protein
MYLPSRVLDEHTAKCWAEWIRQIDSSPRTTEVWLGSGRVGTGAQVFLQCSKLQRIYICIYICIYRHVYIYVYIDIYIYTLVYKYIYTYVCVCIVIRILYTTLWNILSDLCKLLLLYHSYSTWGETVKGEKRYSWPSTPSTSSVLHPWIQPTVVGKYLEKNCVRTENVQIFFLSLFPKQYSVTAIYIALPLY